MYLQATNETNQADFTHRNFKARIRLGLFGRSRMLPENDYINDVSGYNTGIVDTNGSLCRETLFASAKNLFPQGGSGAVDYNDYREKIRTMRFYDNSTALLYRMLKVYWVKFLDEFAETIYIGEFTTVQRDQLHICASMNDLEGAKLLLGAGYFS